MFSQQHSTFCADFKIWEMTIRIHPSWCCWLANRYSISSRTGRARSDFTISPSASASTPSLQYPLASCHWRCHRSRRHRSTSGAWSASKWRLESERRGFFSNSIDNSAYRYHLQQYAILITNELLEPYTSSFGVSKIESLSSSFHF